MRRSVILLATAAGVALAGPATRGQSDPPLRLDGDPASLSADLEAFIPELMARGHVPGLSAAVVRDGRVVWSGGFGLTRADGDEPVTGETLFEAASLTKPLFAYAVLRLVEEGVIDLDTPLLPLLPREQVEAFIGHPLDRDGFRRDWLERITARQVLSHSSGMPHGEPREPLFPLFFEPGSEYKYSAAGYYFLQIVIEQVKDAPIEDLVRELVLDPLGMSQSSMVWRDEYEDSAANGHGILGDPQPLRRYTAAHAAASLYTTAADYARYVCAILNQEGLSGPMRDQMLAPQVEVADDLSWSLGFGLQAGESGPAFWQWGDYVLFRNFVIAYPETGSALVYLTNTYHGLGIGPELVEHVMGGSVAALDWLDYAPYDSPQSRFLWAVLEEGSEVAVTQLPELRALDAETMNEGDMNRLGYQLLFADRADDAIILLDLNVREHPTSANTHDSLGEAYMTRAGPGDIGRAINAYEKALKVLPDDPAINDGFRRGLGQNPSCINGSGKEGVLSVSAASQEAANEKRDCGGYNKVE